MLMYDTQKITHLFVCIWMMTRNKDFNILKVFPHIILKQQYCRGMKGANKRMDVV